MKKLLNFGIGSGTEYRDCTLEWSRSDSHKRWTQNMSNPETREQLIELGYDSIGGVTYTYNEHGFRTEHLHDKGNSIVFLGCSYTEGVGVRYEDTMASIVSKRLNLDCINLGIGGRANDTSFRLANYWLPKLKPRIVVFQPTEHSRMEICTDDREEGKVFFSIGNHVLGNQVDFNMAHRLNDNVRLFFKHYIIPNENTFLNYNKNRFAIENICMHNNIKFIQIYDGGLREWTTLDYGRDLMHPGIKSHQQMAEHVLQLINGSK